MCAWIRLRAGETLTADEVRGFCQGQIAHYKIPRYVGFVDEFPMTVTGKIQKFIMREAVEQRAGAEGGEDGVRSIGRHCEERSDSNPAFLGRPMKLDCFASLAMTGDSSSTCAYVLAARCRPKFS